MSLKFYETLKSILYEVESFLTISLKDVKLPKSVASDKDSILKKLLCLQEDFPQLKTEKAGIVHSNSLKELPTPTPKLPELRDKSKGSVDSQARSAKVDSEIYDDISLDNVSESQDPYKPPSSTSEGSETVSESVVSTTISVKDAMSTCSHSGFLIRGSPGKSKLDIKQLLGGLFGGKKFFCVVGGGIFYIFDKGNSKKQNASFPMRGYEARSSLDLIAAGGKGKESFWFELVSPGQKSYVFAAESQEEMNKWISVLNLEALKIPDPRLSMIRDDDDASSDHQDPPSPLMKNSMAPKKQQSFAKPIPSSSTSVDDELYDDVETAAERIEPDDELYEDAGNGNNHGIEEEIYEAFDEIISQPPVARPPTAVSSISNARPPPTIPSRTPALVPPATQAPVSSPIYSVSPMGENDYENMFYGKWDCRADDDNELAFKRGDVVLILSRDYERFGWWIGKLNGSVGLVPREYMTPAYELIAG